MLNFSFISRHKASGVTTIKPVRLTATEEHQLIDHDSLKTWEQVAKDTIERFNRLLPQIAHRDVTAQLLKLEPTLEEDAIDRLGGPATVVSALYLHLNTPNYTSGCIMLALQLEFVSFLARLTRHMDIGTPEEPAEAEVSDFHQMSNLLGCSLASAITELCSTWSQYSPPVNIIDAARAVMKLARTEVSDRQESSQFLTGIVSVTAGKSYFEGTFALCCPSLLLEKFRADNNGELFGKRAISCVSGICEPLPRRV